MNSSSVFVAFLALLALSSVFVAAAPHNKKHSNCTDKLFHGLQRMCDGKGNEDYLRESAARCCRKNCEVTEMLTFCLVGSEFDDLRF